MKFFLSVIIFGLFVAAVVGQRWIGIGERQPGETLLGFIEDSSISVTPQNHTFQLFYQGVPGNVISYVYVNIDPKYSRVQFPVLGQFYDFWITIFLTNTTYLSANMYVYGFLPGLHEKKNFELPVQEPDIITLNGDDY
uniref:Secreted protein n=1 Tax=Lutzomyia longipalpis TaxID=7200 RepID=A0A7G3B9S2_LUTLO